MSTGFKVFSVKKRDFRHNIWLKRANQKRKYSDQPKKQASYRLLYSLIGWESISQWSSEISRLCTQADS